MNMALFLRGFIIGVIVGSILTAICHAGDIPSMRAPAKYQSAVDHAQDAFLIQVGVQDKINQVKEGVNKTAVYLATQAGIDKPLGSALWCYRVYREKTLSFPIAHRERLTLKPDQVSLTIEF